MAQNDAIPFVRTLVHVLLDTALHDSAVKSDVTVAGRNSRAHDGGVNGIGGPEVS